ncbi:MAG: hypothetical protein ACTSW3_01650 [Promethearchaeota archaeon]
MVRKTISIDTLEKVKKFLKEQLGPVYKSEIVKSLGVNYDSLNIALERINHRVDKKGRIRINIKR